MSLGDGADSSETEGLAVASTARGDRNAAPPGPNDPTRTRAPTPDRDTSEDDGATGPERPARLPASFQLRDPERYEIIGEHGRGGIGRVLRARDRELGRDVAVKELLDRTGTSELRFFREALTTARLEHPGIVPVHEAGRWPDGTPFYAMKLVQGRPLRALIDDCESMADRLALLPHVIAVAEAITYAHDRGIIHRDLKPANVIVGDFGETVVIDWGLAKSVNEPDEDGAGASARGDQDAAGLTAAGSFLGTPAYMAPEQREGRSDERSDIYAIGRILEHVVTGKVPSIEPASPAGGAVRASRRSLPRDLAAIIERAQQSAPDARYPSAQALADDLLRFTQQRPVEARRYSVVGRTLLTLSRNRVLSWGLAFAALFAIAVLGISYVRIQRERTVALRSERSSVDALAKLTLSHAELLMPTDPTAALETLRAYEGADASRAGMLRAQALGMGVARTVVAHTDTVYRLFDGPDGALISVAEDGRVARIFADGKVEQIADDAAMGGAAAYGVRTGLLVYVCRPARVCMLDARTGEVISPNPADHINDATTVALSPGEDRLAVARDANVVVLPVGPSGVRSPPVVVSAPDVFDLRFSSESVVVMRSVRATVTYALLDGRLREFLPSSAIAVSSALIALGTAEGDLRTLDALTQQQMRSVHVCGASVAAVALLPTRGFIGYGCQDGEWGIVKSTSLERIQSFRATGVVWAVESGSDERMLTASVGDGLVQVWDFASQILSSLHGHRHMVSVMHVATSLFPYLVTGDLRGQVRIWEPRPESSEVIAQIDASVLDFGLVAGLGTVALSRTCLYWQTPGRGVTKTPTPDAGTYGLRISPDGTYLVAYSGSGRLMVTSGPDAIPNVSAVGGGPITDVKFHPDGTAFTSIGHDGRVLRWSVSGAGPIELAHIPHSLVALEDAGASGVFVADDHGTIWRIRGGVVSSAFETQALITHLRVSPDRNWVAVGTSAGQVAIVSTANDRMVTKVESMKGSIRLVAFAYDGRLAAIATNEGSVRLVSLAGAAVQAPWSDVPISASSIDFSRDGAWIALTCADGGIWLYSFRRHAWHYVDTGASGIVRGRFLRDSVYLYALAKDGRILRIRTSTFESGAL